ncbi:MAG: hypothetical protein AMXMBFR84_05880 [Candidatus Hydrogenedentota bacterium]
MFKTPGGHRRIRREDLIRFLRENSIPIHGELSSDGTRILVVEPEKTVCAVVQRFLERAQHPFEIEVAPDAFEAGRLVCTFKPDVIFLDMHLPGVDSLDLCRRIKELADASPVRIIATVRLGEPDLASRATESGASQALTKPFTPDDLRRSLAKVGVEIN